MKGIKKEKTAKFKKQRVISMFLHIKEKELITPASL